MISVFLGIGARIVSNSCLNALQKTLTIKGEKASVINFYTYLALTFICLPFLHQINYSEEFVSAVIIMGILGAFGNCAIIKALSYGELSTLAPINSYKPVIALITGVVLLKEIPSLFAVIGIFMIISGTFVLFNKNNFHKVAIIYRITALILSGIEAVFIKKVILLSDVYSALFFWAFFGMVFSLIIAIRNPVKIKPSNIKYQLLLIISTGIMQFTTNYVFSKINVAYALAFFQLSTILSIFIGINIFKEHGLIRKLTACAIMITGAVFIILN